MMSGQDWTLLHRQRLSLSARKALRFISRDEVQVWLDFEGHLSPVNEFLAQLKADGEIRDSSLQLWPE